MARPVHDALRYANTRLLLRHLLAERLQCPPQAVRLDYGPHGKPVLQPENWHFNVSHSREISLLALSRSAAVGIDIEAQVHFL